MQIRSGEVRNFKSCVCYQEHRHPKRFVKKKKFETTKTLTRVGHQTKQCLTITWHRSWSWWIQTQLWSMVVTAASYGGLGASKWQGRGDTGHNWSIERWMQPNTAKKKLLEREHNLRLRRPFTFQCNNNLKQTANDPAKAQTEAM